MTNLPNNLDFFQRISNKTYQENVHESLHNSLADTVEALQKYSGAHQVNSLPAESQVGNVYTLLVESEGYQPGIYVCVAPDPIYLPIASRGEGFVKEFTFENQKNININHGLESRGVFVKVFDNDYNEIQYDEFQIVDNNNVLIKLSVNGTGKIILLAGGKDGMPPAHQWNGTLIRFQNPNGSWGDWVDLIAEIENKGEKGDTGPMPEHEWDGTSIRFRIDEDTWGEWIDLRGPQGLPGVGEPGAPGAPGEDGEDGLGFNWRGTYSILNTYLPNDLVFYNKSAYICVAESTGNAPTNTSFFNLYVQSPDIEGSVSDSIVAEAGEDINCRALFPKDLIIADGVFKVGTPLEFERSYNKKLNGFGFFMKKIGTPIGNYTLKIYSKTDGVKNAEADFTYTRDASEIDTDFDLEFFYFNTVNKNGDYVFEFTTVAGDASNYLEVKEDVYVDIYPSPVATYIGTDGKVYLSSNSGVRNNFVGFVSESKVAGDMAHVQFIGEVEDMNLLEVGKNYYLSSVEGEIGLDVGDIKVGVALNDSTLLVQNEVVKVKDTDLITKEEDGLGLKAINPESIVYKGNLVGGQNISSSLKWEEILKPINESFINQNSAGSNADANSSSWQSQSFIANKAYIAGIMSYVYNNNSETNPLIIEIYNSTVDNKPTGSALYTKSVLKAETSSDGYLINCKIPVTIGNKYCLVYRAPGAIYTWVVPYSTSNPYTDGVRNQSTDAGSNWSTPNANHDLRFGIYLADAPDSNPRYSINVDDVLYENNYLDFPYVRESMFLSVGGSSSNNSIYGSFKMGNTFTVGSRNIITKITPALLRIGTPSGNVTLSIFEINSSNFPTGSAIATKSIPAGDINSGTIELTNFIFETPVALEKGKTYCWYIELPGNSSSNYVRAYFNSPGGFGRVYYNGSNWTFDSTMSIYAQMSGTGVPSTSEIATALQTQIRSLTGKTETVEYKNSKFTITSSINATAPSSVLRLISPSIGTDVSGNASDGDGGYYLDLGVNATENIGTADAGKIVRVKNDGLLPEEIIPSKNIFLNNFTKNAGDNSVLQVIPHNLGKLPKLVEIYGYGYYRPDVYNEFTMIAHAIHNGASQISSSVYKSSGTGNTMVADNTFRIGFCNNSGQTWYSQGVVTFDEQNIYINWTRTGDVLYGTYAFNCKAY